MNVVLVVIVAILNTSNLYELSSVRARCTYLVSHPHDPSYALQNCHLVEPPLGPHNSPPPLLSTPPLLGHVRYRRHARVFWSSHPANSSQRQPLLLYSIFIIAYDFKPPLRAALASKTGWRKVILPRKTRQNILRHRFGKRLEGYKTKGDA